MQINSGLVLGLAGTLSGLLMAMLGLVLARAPGWAELRSFAIVALAAAAYCFFDLVHVVPVSEHTLVIGEGLALGSVLAYGLTWIRHFAIVGGRRLRRFEWITMVIGGGMVLSALVPGVLIGPPLRSVRVDWLGATYTMGTATWLGVACVAFIILAMLVAAFGGGRRWRDGWHARLPMLGATILAIAGVSDTFSFMQVIPMPQLTEAVSVVVVGAIGFSYVNRFIADARRLEALSMRLEQEVAARTGELVTAQAAAVQHERLAGLGRIAAGVAHEINNPTQVVQLNLTWMRALLVENASLTPELATRLERSHAATQRIAEIVRQLLEAGRPPTDVANVTRFQLAPVVTKAIAAASVTAPSLAITVVMSDALHVSGDPTYLEQVLINLLGNAAHATKSVSGGRTRVEAIHDGDRVRIEVSDNGSGIPAIVRERLFEPFTTTKPVGEGTGLGLAVSRGLMTRQGGALYVTRSSAEGTVMTIELPAADAAELVTAVPLTPRIASDRSDVRVLVIDDDDDIREMLGLQLDRFFQVDAAATVDDAIAMIRTSTRYDVVLCDLMMPSGGAETWLARCGTLDARLAERTILLTAGPTTDAAAALVEDRRERVLYKPVDLEMLRPMIERVAR